MRDVFVCMLASQQITKNLFSAFCSVHAKGITKALLLQCLLGRIMAETANRVWKPHLMPGQYDLHSVRSAEELVVEVEQDTLYFP